MTEYMENTIKTRNLRRMQMFKDSVSKYELYSNDIGLKDAKEKFAMIIQDDMKMIDFWIWSYPITAMYAIQWHLGSLGKMCA